MKTSPLTIVTFIAVALFSIDAHAEKFPISLGELQQSDLIVVGTINKIRVESEGGVWGIYLTITMETLEKGNVADGEFEFRCFRTKSTPRLSDLFAPVGVSGHHPIPGEGTRVRAYLNSVNSNQSSYAAALPNGITSVEDTSDYPGGNLQDAPEVTRLFAGRRFTYILPLEMWILILSLILFVGVPSYIIARVMFIRRFSK